MTELRCASIDLEAARASLLGSLAPLAAVADLVSLTLSEDQADEALVSRVAAALAARLPASLCDALARLADDELDVLLIDGEPERDDLPGSWDGVARRFEGGLIGDWLGLAITERLGATRAHERAFDQLGLEAQIGHDALHRDILPYAPGDERGLPPSLARWAPQPGWSPAYLPSRFSSLVCLRAGDNRELTTVFTQRTNFLDTQLRDWLAQLSRPVYRCELLEAAGAHAAFAIVYPLEAGGHELSVAALNSSLFLDQGSHGSRLRCPDDDARAALHAFDRARVELERYEHAIHWRPGRRVIFNQRELLHGRRGGLRVTTDEGWERARWMLRWNATPSRASPAPLRSSDARAVGDELAALVPELATAHRRCKPAYLAAHAGPRSDTNWLVNFLRHSEW